MTVLASPKARVLPGEGFSRGSAPITLLVGVHFVFLALFFEPAISTPDANGYMAQARLIAREGRSQSLLSRGFASLLPLKASGDAKPRRTRSWDAI